MCGRPKADPGVRVAGPVNEDSANPLGVWPWMTSYGRMDQRDAVWTHMCGGR